jgi:agmatine deiminase
MYSFCPRTRLCAGFALMLVSLLLLPATAQEREHPFGKGNENALPRWREGGTPAPPPDQPLTPFALERLDTSDVPDTGLILSPTEYAPTDGILVCWVPGQWTPIVEELVVGLTRNPAYDEIAYVVVRSEANRDTAAANFAAQGADMSKVRFLIHPLNALWIRDYGPHFITQDGVRAIVDSEYYPTRPSDNFIPTLVAEDDFVIPSYDINLYYSGGNFQATTNRHDYITSLIFRDNPYQGVDTQHIFPQLPPTVDGTGHIDMWMYIIDDDSVIISEFEPGSNQQAIEITNNAVPYMEALGFTVTRTPAIHTGSGFNVVHWTYTNAFRVNDRIFIPIYGAGDPDMRARDAAAIAAWESAAPQAEIIPVNCRAIIPAAGAIHCIIMQVPRRVEPVPAAVLISPRGGELLVVGGTHEVVWGSTDDQGVTGVDLYCSLDGGASFPLEIARDLPANGRLLWTVPDTPSDQVRLRAVARDGEGHQTAADSRGDLRIVRARQRVYDFTSGGGLDKRGFGHQTLDWVDVEGQRIPPAASTEITSFDPDAYLRLAASDATGDRFDGNRYISPTVSTGQETTHTFEFLIGEDPADILDIGLRWEGFLDACTMAQLHVWDDVQGNWSDANGTFGRFGHLDNAAANRDAILSGHIRGDFGRYLTADGALTLLVYGTRQRDESFHDYVRVTVTYEEGGCAEDCTGDGRIDQGDLALLLSCYGVGDCCDVDGDGNTDQADLAALLARFGETCR